MPMTDTKHCAIVPAQMERVTIRNGWFVTGYRVVDMEDKDILQPWFKSHKEAALVAVALGYKVV